MPAALDITFSFCPLEIPYQQFLFLKFKKKKSERKGKKNDQELCPAARDAVVSTNDRDLRCHCRRLEVENCSLGMQKSW